jgi:hypothetical protein
MFVGRRASGFVQVAKGLPEADGRISGSPAAERTGR